MEKIHFETKLYTNIWEFIAPFSMAEVNSKINEWNGILTLSRFEVRSRLEWEKRVLANTKVNVYLDTNKTPILCYEEAEMTDKEEVELIDKKVKSKK